LCLSEGKEGRATTEVPHRGTSSPTFKPEWSSCEGGERKKSDLGCRGEEEKELLLRPGRPFHENAWAFYRRRKTVLPALGDGRKDPTWCGGKRSIREGGRTILKEAERGIASEEGGDNSSARNLLPGEGALSCPLVYIRHSYKGEGSCADSLGRGREGCHFMCLVGRERPPHWKEKRGGSCGLQIGEINCVSPVGKTVSFNKGGGGLLAPI